MDTTNQLSLPVDGLGLLVGLVVLFFGRKLFWLFVAAAGFLLGTQLAPELIPSVSEAVLLAVGIVLGLLGALAALFLQKAAVRLAGVVAGLYLTDAVLRSLEVEIHAMYWAYLALGGVVGLLLMAFLFEWTLIFLSAFTGAMLAAESISLPPVWSPVAILGLALLGILVQAKFFHRNQKP